MGAVGATLTVRLTPRAGRDRIVGFEIDGRGQRVLKVAVAAPPVDGAANEALVALLAKQLGLPKSAVTLVAGASARLKRLALAGDPARLDAALRALGSANP
jgi:uncharacterized protein (TIGR00251 family)